jgi:hypothetical protein
LSSPADGDDLERKALEGVRHLLEIGKLLPTRGAPRRPEVDEDHLAPKFAELELRAVHALNGEVRRGKVENLSVEVARQQDLGSLAPVAEVDVKGSGQGEHGAGHEQAGSPGRFGRRGGHGLT